MITIKRCTYKADNGWDYTEIDVAHFVGAIVPSAKTYYFHHGYPNLKDMQGGATVLFTHNVRKTSSHDGGQRYGPLR